VAVGSALRFTLGGTVVPLLVELVVLAVSFCKPARSVKFAFEIKSANF
jgi:hypothetical protein